jgi:hypothetical protein
MQRHLVQSTNYTWNMRKISNQLTIPKCSRMNFTFIIKVSGMCILSMTIRAITVGHFWYRKFIITIFVTDKSHFIWGKEANHWNRKKDKDDVRMYKQIYRAAILTELDITISLRYICNSIGRTCQLSNFPRKWQGIKLAIQEHPQGLIGRTDTAVLSTHLITTNSKILLWSGNVSFNKDFLLLY